SFSYSWELVSSLFAHSRIPFPWQVVLGFSCCCGDLWGAELEVHSPVIAVGLAA
ncbi:hypothetical protein GIB67_018171, partial [Kingdonia uniflora]